MTPTEGIHIKCRGKLWLVERGNYLLGEFPTQQEAIELGRVRAKSSRSTLVIHSEDGSINARESYKEHSSRKRVS
jgi:hypothetical protein